MKTQLKRNFLALAITASFITSLTQTAIAKPPMGMGGGHQQNEQTGLQQGGPDTSAILVRMDYNEDGFVTLDDFINHSLERADKHFIRMDSDEDGAISEAEYANSKPNRENNSSIDHDVLKLCIEDATGLTIKDRPTPEDSFIAIDTNSDAYISLDEFLDEKVAHAEERFNELDSNADGILSEDEITTDLTKRQTIHAAHESCISEQLILDESSVIL